MQGRIQDLIRGGAPDRDWPKTAILGPQFWCWGLIFGGQGGGPGPPGPPPPGSAPDMLPKRLVNLFEIKHHDCNTRNRNAPSIPEHGSKMYNNSFMCKSASNWLQISADVKDKKYIKLFARSYKKSLLS